jgi:hypothetical protein
MARKVETTLVDDMTGDAADETVSFSLDGVEFEIDLSAHNAGILCDILRLCERGTEGRQAHSRAEHSFPSVCAVAGESRADRCDPRVGPRIWPPGVGPWPHLR